MKRRLGFVTNSSSTNSILTAATTAVTSGIASAVINVNTADVENQIVENAAIVLELEASHPEKCLRLNDPHFMVDVFATVRRRTLHYAAAGGGLVLENVETYYGDASMIEFQISNEVRDWVNTSEASMVGGAMAIRLVGESVAYENRHFQPDCPKFVKIGARCQVGEYLLSTSMFIELRDEALLFGRTTYALNDPDVITNVPLELYYGWPYKWRMEHDVTGTEIENYCQMETESRGEEFENNGKAGMVYNLHVRPDGKELPNDKKGAISLQSRIDVTGIPSERHISEVTDFLDLILIEEGMFFEGKTDSKGSLMVESYIKSKEEDASTEMAPTGFQVKCVVKKENEDGNGHTAEFLDMDEVELEFGDLIGTNSPSESLVQVYKYDVKKSGQGGRYDFHPLMSVPYSDVPLNVVLPVSCTIKGEEYELEIPVKIQGQPIGRPEAWEMELKNLIHMIKNYVEPEKQLAIIQGIKMHQAHLSVESLRLRRRYVWEEARRDLLEEAKDHMATAEYYEWAESCASALKWVGDQAFAYLMNYWGGALAEAFLVPFKDITVTVVGELTAEYFFGSGTMTEDQLYTANLNSIISAVENEIMRDFDLKGISLKKVGRYFAAIAVVNFLKHYYLDTKKDGSPIGFWDAIVSTCSDLSVNYFKAIVGNKFEELMTMPQTKEFFEKYASKYVKELVNAATNNLDLKQLNVIGKYLSEMTGVVVATVNGEVIQGVKNSSMNVTDNDIIITVKLNEKVTVDISLMQMKDDLFNYIFDFLFSSFPYAPVNKRLDMPSMPPCYH